jgi:hypothetical protein
MKKIISSGLLCLSLISQSLLASEESGLSSIIIGGRDQVTVQDVPMPTEKIIYTIKPRTGEEGRKFLSTSYAGDAVDLWSADLKLGRQSWVFIKLYDDVYRIEVRKPGSARKMLSCSADGSIVDLWHVDDGSGQQKWQLIPLPDGTFNIKSVGATGRRFLSCNGDGSIVDLWHEDDESGRQKWRLIPEDLEIIDIVFDTKNNGRLTPQPDFVVETNVVNETDTDQSMTAAFEKKAVFTSSFEHEHGFTFEISAKQQWGLPTVAQGEISVTAATQHKWTEGKTQTAEDTRTYTFPVVAPRNSSVKARATVSRVKLDVPYTVTGKSKITGEIIKSTGVWRGISVGQINFSLAKGL